MGPSLEEGVDWMKCSIAGGNSSPASRRVEVCFKLLRAQRFAMVMPVGGWRKRAWRSGMVAPERFAMLVRRVRFTVLMLKSYGWLKTEMKNAERDFRARVESVRATCSFSKMVNSGWVWLMVEGGWVSGADSMVIMVSILIEERNECPIQGAM